MRIIKYNKLIRDNIPAIMTKAGKQYTISALDDEEYCTKLKEKMIEEAREVYDADRASIVGELADVLEVLEAIEEYYGIDHECVIEKKKKKAKSNGRFTKRLLLIEAIEND